FVFKRRNPELHLILGEMPVLSEKWVDGRPFDQLARVAPIGSGPYVVDAFACCHHIRYRRTPKYSGLHLPGRHRPPHFHRIPFSFFKDRPVSLQAFKLGAFHIFFEGHSKRCPGGHEGPRYASGEITKVAILHHNNAGMQGIVFNTRRSLFADRRVREALGLAMDFEWSNRNLFYGQYTRCDSYFSNSELAARGLPDEAQLALLEPFRDRLPPEVFTKVYRPPYSPDAAALRANLIRAKQLLEEAGWHVKDGVLVNAEGRPFRFEIMLGQKGFERIMAPYVYNLRKLGIEASYRTIDPALYQRRLDTFDFDAVIEVFGQSQSPGNELLNMFHSASSEREGSNNYMGVKDPVVDALVEKIVYAKDRKALVDASRALDRVLLWGHYLVPNWYIGVHRLAYWDHFGYPQTLPLYFEAEPWVLKTWWHKP
ncbi:MAG: extracellular solute-binding protein, partial [Halothiobacillaceae bacterium]